MGIVEESELCFAWSQVYIFVYKTPKPAAHTRFFPLRPSGLYSRLLFPSTLERSTVVIPWHSWFGQAHSRLRIPLKNMGTRYLFCKWEEIVFSYCNYLKWDVTDHQQGRGVAQYEVRGMATSQRTSGGLQQISNNFNHYHNNYTCTLTNITLRIPKFSIIIYKINCIIILMKIFTIGSSEY